MSLTVEPTQFTPDGWCQFINDWATSKGWNETERSLSEEIALMHTELSEAFEAYRNGDSEVLWYEKDGKPEGVPIELVDCVIRIMHFFGRHEISMNQLLSVKMHYNMTRPYRHGGKKA